jgi:phage FluMu gp28-like protein
MPFEQQKQVFAYVMDNLPRMLYAALDGTGNGVYLGEWAVGHYGEQSAESIKLSLPWYQEHFPPLHSRFEEKAILIPRDLDVRNDLAKVEVLDGIPRLSKKRVAAEREDKFKGEKRHGDAAVGLLMLDYASRQNHLAYGYKKADRRGGDFAYEGLL